MTFADEMKDREFRQAFNSDYLRCKIAADLRRRRKRKKLSQATVAKRAGMVQNQVARAENPNNGITLDQLVRVADGLGLVPKIIFIPPR